MKQMTSYVKTANVDGKYKSVNEAESIGPGNVPAMLRSVEKLTK